jgi:hypothetical protein
MTIQEANKILLYAKFNVGNGIMWQFNETTLIINGTPLTQYRLYEENGKCFLHTNVPVTIAEDYCIESAGENHTPFKIILRPKFTPDKFLILEQEYSF